jgi:hypothetical protein
MRRARPAIVLLGCLIAGRPAVTDLIANVSDRIPLGVVRAGPQDVWVMETPSGESNAFVLYDIGSSAARRLLRVDAGGC